MNHNEYFVAIEACEPGRAAMSKYASAEACWAALISPTGERRPDWAVWWVCRVRGWASVEPVVRRAVLRAVRYAADACEKAGLIEHASKLRATKDDAPFAEIRSTAVSAYSAAAKVSATAAFHAAGDAAEAAGDADDAATYSTYSTYPTCSTAATAGSSAHYAASAAPSGEQEINAQLKDIGELLSCPWTENP